MLDLVGEDTTNDGASRSSRTGGLGCLVGVIAIVLVVGVVAWTVYSVDWGPPARGLAAEADLHPLPQGAEVVGTYGACEGNGDGWHLCERRLRLRLPGRSQTELAKLLADGYRSRGHRLDDLSAGQRFGDDDELYGWADCLGSISKENGLCIAINTPENRSFSRINEAPGPHDVDVSAWTWTYFI